MGSCQQCSILRLVCTHNIKRTTAQCWQGKHSGTCASWCECKCHTGTYPLKPITPPVTQEEVDAAIASIMSIPAVRAPA